VRDERWSKSGDEVHDESKTRNTLRVKLRNYLGALPRDLPTGIAMTPNDCIGIPA
jgi:hypothetical protein